MFSFFMAEQVNMILLCVAENLLNAVSGGGPLSVALLDELMAPFNKGLASIVGTIFHQGWQKLDRLI
jgi:hypothetical protein